MWCSIQTVAEFNWCDSRVRMPVVLYNGPMFSKEQAFSIARTTEAAASMERAQETEHGWYFGIDTDAVGCNGLIVNKKRGSVFRLGSGFPIERDLALYDKVRIPTNLNTRSGLT
jgi:hypothetical protein